MTTKQYSLDYIASHNIYVRIWNEDGEVFDASDNTFKAIGSATTPYITCAEQAGIGGTGRSDYVVTLDYALIYGGTASKEFRVRFYDNVAPTVGDLDIAGTSFTLPLPNGGFVDQYECKQESAFTTTAGTEIRFLAYLNKNGQSLVLPSGTCTIAVREHGAGADLFTVSDSAPNTEGYFEMTKSLPGFTDDRIYMATVTISDGTNTYSSKSALQVVG